MVNVNNNFNVIPWYSSLEQQNHRKWYAFDKQWPLIMPNTRFLPFQFVLETTPTNISAITVYSEDKSITRNLGIAPIAVPNAEKGYCVVMLHSEICDFTAALPEGRYYATLTIDGETLYSEVFTVVGNIGSYLKLTYWNTDTLYYKNGEINYANDFRYEMYLDTTIGKPEYEFSEELTTRLGYKFLESQISNKLYKFVFLGPEFICDAMRLIRLSDYIKLESGRDSYNAISFSYEPSWETQGDLASIEVSFETDTIIQKLPSFNRNQRENFYNALLSSASEPLLYDEGVVAQYYTAFSDAITGKLTRQLAEANVEEITKSTMIPIDQGLGAAQRVSLLALFERYGGSENAYVSELQTTVSNHVSNRDIHLAAGEREKLTTLLSMFYFDKENNAVRTTYNMIVDQALSFGGAGKSEDPGAGITSLYALPEIKSDMAGSLKDGEVLAWDASQGLWVNKAISSGLNTDELDDYLTTNKYITQEYVNTALKSYALKATTLAGYGITDALSSTTKYALGDDIGGNAVNANKFGNQLPTYYATADGLTGVSNRVKTLEDVIGIDANGDVYIKKNGTAARNFYTYGAISFGGLGESTGGSGGLTQVTIKLGTTEYKSESGVVSLPSYPTIPVNVSEFNNDSNYATEGWVTDTALNGYATQQWVLNKGYATTSDLDTRINNLINGAPAAYDTLKEIADVLAGNVNSIGDILTALDTKAPKATTLSGYGITDAKIANGVITLGTNTITPLTASSSLAWDKLADTPTTLAGYGITDALSATTKYALGDAVGGNAVNANKFGNQLPSYYATADGLTGVSNRVKTLEDVIGIDANGDVYIKKNGEIARNFYTYGAISFGGAGTGSGGGAGATMLSALTDVAISNPTNGQSLVFNGTKWVNKVAGLDSTALWNLLGSSGSELIDSSHIPDLSGKYLPKSGGRLTSTNNTPLIIDSATSDSWVAYYNGDTFLGSIGVDATKGPVVYTAELATKKAIIHEGNISSQYTQGLTHTTPTMGTFTLEPFTYGYRVVGQYATFTIKTTNIYNAGLNFADKDGGKWSFSYRGLNNADKDFYFYKLNNEAESVVMSFDYSSEYVGIGTPSPAYKLDVNGSANATTLYQNGKTLDKYYLPLSGGTLEGDNDILKITGVNNSYILFSLGKTSSASVGYYNNLAYIASEIGGYARIGIADDGTPQYWTSYTGDTKHTLIHSGNIGSYSAGGAYKLVNSSGTSVLSVGSNSQLYDINNNILLAVNPSSAGTTLWRAFGANDGVVSIIESGKNIVLKTAGTDRVVISSTGKFGIGNTSPTYDLDLFGVGRIRTSERIPLYICSTHSYGPIVSLYGDNASLLSELGHIPATASSDYGTFLSNKESDIGILLGSDRKVYISEDTDSLAKTHEVIHSGNIGNQSVRQLSYSSGSLGTYTIKPYDYGFCLEGQYPTLRIRNSNQYNAQIEYADKDNISRWGLGYRGLNSADHDFYIYKIADGVMKPMIVFDHSSENVLIGSTDDNGRKFQVGGQMSAIERITIFNYNTNPTHIKSFVYSGVQYTSIGGADYPLIINNDTGVVGLTKSADNRQVNIHPSGSLEFRGATGGWAMGVGFNHNNGTHIGSACGGLGGNNTFQYYFYGGAYDNSAMYIHPTQNVTIGTTTDDKINKLQVFKNSTNGDIASFKTTSSWNTLCMYINGAQGWSFGIDNSENFYFYSHRNARVVEFNNKGAATFYGGVTSYGAFWKENDPSYTAKNMFGAYIWDNVVQFTKRDTSNVYIKSLFELNMNDDSAKVFGNLVVTGAITFGSDARYKNKLSDVSIDLETIANAPLFNYRWTDREDDKVHLGTTAQYWNETAFRNAVCPTNDEKLWTMSYSEVAMGNTIVIARELLPIKREVSKIEKLESRVSKLERILREHNINFE